MRNNCTSECVDLIAARFGFKKKCSIQVDYTWHIMIIAWFVGQLPT